MTREDMLDEARRLGIKGVGRMKPETLAARIAEAKAEPVPETAPEPSAPSGVSVVVMRAILRTSAGRFHHGDHVALPRDEAERLKHEGAVE